MDSEDLELLNIIFSEEESDEDAFLMKLSGMLDDSTIRKREKRKYWVRPYYTGRDETGAFQTVFRELKLNDSDIFFTYMRMTPAQFDELLKLVGPSIRKQTLTRKPIEPASRLAITIRYLATGESQRSLSTSYKCSPAIVHFIIRETTHAIIEALKTKVFPRLDEGNYLKIADGFARRWNFPHCMGAIDGKHVAVQAPSESGSTFFNYKKFYSIVLLAICDHDYNFIMCDIGAAGRQSDGGIFRHCMFGKKFFSNSLSLPAPRNLTNSIQNVPYVFVADDAFGLHKNILKPYSNSPLSTEQRIFNYRLSRARRMIENSFGVLVSKWRILRQPIISNIDTAEKIVGACVCLHNWLRQQKSGTPYISPGLIDGESSGTLVHGTWRSEQPSSLQPIRTNSYNSTAAAKEVRAKFTKYFVTDGAVSWQMEKI